MFYERNKKRAEIRTTTPTLTDQSQARETDINIIVGRMLQNNTVTGNAAQPMYGDFTELPPDLRGMIDHIRSIDELRNRLPTQLKSYNITDLMSLTNEQLITILNPPKQPTDTTDKT